MALTSLLSEDPPAPPQPEPKPTPVVAPSSPANLVRKTPKPADEGQTRVKSETAPVAQSQDIAQPNGYTPSNRRSSKPTPNGDYPTHALPVAQAPPPLSGPPGLTVRQTEEAIEQIEAQELSDVEQPGSLGSLQYYNELRDEYRSRSRKRMIELEYKEDGRRKVIE